ncbi:MAG TPA: NAD(P)H-dependent oxidoreductase [Candidatus Fimivivens sp.]|nr:NAD(P)H-dependent oxidoreductase [Candidatus Fimivivens sp.]
MSFLDHLDWRFATKKFDPEKRVSDESVAKILEAIRMTPSAYGLQPYHVRVVTDAETKKKLSDASYGQPQPSDASHVLVFFSRTDIMNRIDAYAKLVFGDEAGSEQAVKMVGRFRQMAGRYEGSAGADWAARQTYIALGFALAAAAELEVDSCPMEGCDFSAVKGIFDLPEIFTPALLLPIGYRMDGSARPKARFPKEDLFTVPEE